MSLINWHDSGRTLQIRTALLTTRQRARLEAMFAEDVHVPVEVTWLVYQQVITAYAHPDPREGAKLLHPPDLERADEAMTGRLEALRRSSLGFRN